jgi:glutamyl-tRNA synthetase
VHDRVCGDITVDRSEEPDMTLRRPDGSYIFHFTNVIDDLEMKISHVIRGEDHLINTAKHLELFEALGAKPPEYAHIPLILNMDGSKMSKRDRGAAMHSYIDEAFVPAAVRNFLCLLGWSSKDDRQKLAIDEVIHLFTWDHLNRSPARFDLEKCLWLNSQYLAEAGEAQFLAWSEAWLASHPPPEGVVMTAGQLEAALRLLKPKIKHLPELHEHLSMLFNPDHPVEAEARAKATSRPEVGPALIDLAGRFGSIEPGAWTVAALKSEIESAAAAAGVKSGSLMFPLRVALTGAGHGADLVPAIEIIGKSAAIDRLSRRLPMLFT